MQGLREDEEEWGSGEGTNPINTESDRWTGFLFSNVLPRKVDDAYAIKRIGHDLEFLGHKRMILKSDQDSIKEGTG